MDNQIVCELCGLKYVSEMIVDKKFSDFIQCYDCLFFMNFNDKDILNGSMGYNLTKYLEISKKYHMQNQEIPCHRLNDNGGCYVCMSLLDIPFDNPNDDKNNKFNKNIIDKNIIDKNIIDNNIDNINGCKFNDIKFKNELDISDNIEVILSI